MPRSRKLFIHGLPYFITFRTEEGLPFSAGELLNKPIWGILARAQSRYPVRVCAFLFMSNHVHMLLVAENPEDIPNFIRHVKTESAHLINRLLGRRRRTLWAAGYDSVAILTMEQCIEKLAYIFTNPQKIRLVNTIENHPLPNSWQMFLSNKLTKQCPWVRRPAIHPLEKYSLKTEEQKTIASGMLEFAKIRHQFVLSPYAWLAAFPEAKNIAPEEIRDEIVARVRDLERTFGLEQPNVLGAKYVCQRDISSPYQPKKFGRRMLCICSDRAKRTAFLQLYFELAEKAREAYRAWKRGDFSKMIPPGMFAPGGAYRSSLLLSAFPVPLLS